jgi:large subunit ribosomal protein L24
MAAKIRRNDTVRVMAGKDRGRQGEVRQVFPAKSRAIVTGVNMSRRHRRARSATEPGGIVDVEAAIHVSNLRLVCPSCDAPVRVGFRLLDDGRKVRYCKRCDEAVD